MSLENEMLQKLAEAISNLNATATTATVPQAPEVQAVSVKLPEFWPDDPEVWFIRVEAQLRSRAITQDHTRFDYVVAALDNRAIVEIKAVLTNPPQQDKYNTIKKALLSAFGKTQAQKDAELLNISGLGDRKPTALLRHLESLNNDAATLRRAFFLAQLPTQVLAILALKEIDDISELANAADRIMEASQLTPTNSTAAAVHAPKLKSQAVTSKLQRPVSSTQFICFYHQRFGTEARNCRPGCKFAQLLDPSSAHNSNLATQGNVKAGRR